MAKTARQERREARHTQVSTGLADRLDRAARTGRIPKAEAPPSRVIITEKFAPVPPDEPEEESWEVELPPLDPADIAHAVGHSLSALEAGEPELDRLWDWVRADEDRGQKFLGVAPATSAEMRAKVAEFDITFALMDSLQETEPHVGFISLQAPAGDYLLVHIYLAQHVRGEARRLIPQLMELAENTYPGKQFLVKTEDPAMARLLQSVGFSAGFILTWASARLSDVAPVEESVGDETQE